MMSSRPHMIDEWKVFGRAARAYGISATKVREEVERLYKMIIHEEIEVERINPETRKKEVVLVEMINPETQEKELVPLMRTVKVQEMISSTFIYVSQARYFRTSIKPDHTQQLNILSGVVKRMPKRGIYRSLPYMKDFIRNELLKIINVAYPETDSLVPEGTGPVLNALAEQQKRQPQGLTDFDRQFSPEFIKQLDT